MLTSPPQRHSTNLCLRFVRIERSRISFSFFSRTSELERLRDEVEGMERMERSRMLCSGSVAIRKVDRRL